MLQKNNGQTSFVPTATFFSQRLPTMLQREGNKDERERSKIVCVGGGIMKTIGQIGDKTLPDKKCETVEWSHEGIRDSLSVNVCATENAGYK